MNQKSILKKSHSIPTSAARPPLSQHDRTYDTALYHANLIQAQKDAESLILASTERLLDLPSSPIADPTCPSPQDAALVKNSLRSFQPSDYDALIEERNINKTCGYILCPRPNRVQPTTAKFRILYAKGKGSNALRVVDKAYLEKWCSDDCGRRALYIKVQLNEEPAWLRSAGRSGDIVLLDERSNPEMQVLEGMRDLNIIAKEQDVVAQMKALAIERGDGNAPSRSFGLVDIGVKENMDCKGKTPKAPKATTNGELTSGLIEGYQPRYPILTARSEDASDDEREDEDVIETI